MGVSVGEVVLNPLFVSGNTVHFSVPRPEGFVMVSEQGLKLLRPGSLIWKTPHALADGDVVNTVVYVEECCCANTFQSGCSKQSWS